MGEKMARSEMIARGNQQLGTVPTTRIRFLSDGKSWGSEGFGIHGRTDVEELTSQRE
jgi:hypothetical protein